MFVRNTGGGPVYFNAGTLFSFAVALDALQPILTPRWRHLVGYGDSSHIKNCLEVAPPLASLAETSLFSFLISFIHAAHALAACNLTPVILTTFIGAGATTSRSRDAQSSSASRFSGK